MNRGFRIAELARRSGTPKETIHYYLRIGLLRKPKKTSRNMAYYDDGHVEQLKLIKRLRTESYLPLSVIKKVLKDGRLAESTRRIDLAGDLFGQSAKTEYERLSAGQLAEKVGVPTDRIEAYEQAGLLLPKLDGGDGRYGWEDLRVAEILGNAEKEAGTTAESFVLERFQLLEKHVTELVREESAHFFASLFATSNPKLAMDLLRGGRDTVGRYLAIARVRRLRYEIEALLREVEGALQEERPRLAPGELNAPDEAIERTEELLIAHEKRPNSSEAAVEFFEHLLMQGSETEVVDRYDKLRSRLKRDPRIQVIAAEAMTDVMRFDDALRLLEPLRKASEGNDLVLDLLIATATLGRLRDRLIASASSDEKASSFEVIGDLVNGLHHLYAARDADPIEPRWNHIRLRLLLGRLECALPGFLGRGRSGRKELRQVIEETKAIRGTDDDPRLGILDRIEWVAARSLAHRTRKDEEREAMNQLAKDIESK